MNTLKNKLVLMSIGLIGVAINGQAIGKDYEWALDYIKVPIIYVESNGVSYTAINQDLVPHTLKYTAKLQLGVGRDKIRDWKVAPIFLIPGLSIPIWGNQFGADLNSPRLGEPWGIVSRKYSAPRPSLISETISINVERRILNQFVVAACNAKAGSLRAKGFSNDEIFSENQIVFVNMGDRINFSYTQVLFDYDAFIGHSPVDLDGEIVCLKSNRSRRTNPKTPQELALPTEVTHASVVLKGITGPVFGNCKIQISTYLQTNRPNRGVNFRFQDRKGNESNILSITTNDNSESLKTHTYTIPNTALWEQGDVRVVGVDPYFESNWDNYWMACHEKEFKLEDRATGNIDPTDNESTDVSISESDEAISNLNDKQSQQISQ